MPWCWLHVYGQRVHVHGRHRLQDRVSRRCVLARVHAGVEVPGQLDRRADGDVQRHLGVQGRWRRPQRGDLHLGVELRLQARRGFAGDVQHAGDLQAAGRREQHAHVLGFVRLQHQVRRRLQGDLRRGIGVRGDLRRRRKPGNDVLARRVRLRILLSSAGRQVPTLRSLAIPRSMDRGRPCRGCRTTSQPFPGQVALWRDAAGALQRSR